MASPLQAPLPSPPGLPVGAPPDGAGSGGAGPGGARSGGAPPVGARRDDVRRTAARLFERRGYAATTISDIAEAAGILPGSLYHHFASKEDIAVDLLASYSRALAALGTAAVRRTEIAGRSRGTDPAAGHRRGPARLRARGRGPAQRLRGAQRGDRPVHGRDPVPLPALERAWRIAVQSLAAAGRPPAADLGLLRFSLQRVTALAPLYYPADLGPDELAGHLCDLLLHGLLTDPPPFEELDRSAAYRTALEVTGCWGARPTRGPGDARRGAPADITGTILAAARTEFARRGYEATTIRDIARRRRGGDGLPVPAGGVQGDAVADDYRCLRGRPERGVRGGDGVQGVPTPNACTRSCACSRTPAGTSARSRGSWCSAGTAGKPPPARCTTTSSPPSGGWTR